MNRDSATTLVRQYMSQQEYEHDAQKLANLGYVVFSVVAPPAPRGWVQRLLGGGLGSAQPRLTVSYRDQGVVR
jgi:hypothetical protein